MKKTVSKIAWRGLILSALGLIASLILIVGDGLVNGFYSPAYKPFVVFAGCSMLLAFGSSVLFLLTLIGTNFRKKFRDLWNQF